MDREIREAGASDFEHLCDLFVEENRFHANLVPEYIQITPHMLIQEELQELLTSPTQQIIICERGNALLGALIVSLKEEMEDRWKKHRLIGYVEDLIVTDAAQGEGIGKQLMHAARDWIVSQGIETIELCLWETNIAARYFYESLGIKSVQRRMTWAP